MTTTRTFGPSRFVLPASLFRWNSQPSMTGHQWGTKRKKFSRRRRISSGKDLCAMRTRMGGTLVGFSRPDSSQTSAKLEVSRSTGWLRRRRIDEN